MEQEASKVKASRHLQGTCCFVKAMNKCTCVRELFVCVCKAFSTAIVPYMSSNKMRRLREAAGARAALQDWTSFMYYLDAETWAGLKDAQRPQLAKLDSLGGGGRAATHTQPPHNPKHDPHTTHIHPTYITGIPKNKEELTNCTCFLVFLQNHVPFIVKSPPTHKPHTIHIHPKKRSTYIQKKNPHTTPTHTHAACIAKARTKQAPLGLGPRLPFSGSIAPIVA